LEYLSVFDSEKEGSLRVDANISIRGSERVEVKNITSYKGVEKALTFEVTRQKNLLRRGQKVDRETRHYLEARGVTQSARSKEQEHDYRYFPEPDLRPLRVRSWVDNIILPELPDARRERFMKEYGISLNHARTLTGDFKLANFFEKWAKEYRKNKELKSPVLDINKQEVLRIPPKGTLLISVPSTWVADTLIGELNYREMGFDEILSGDFYEKFAKLTILLDDNHITSNSAIEVLRVMLNQLKNKEFVESPNDIVNRLGLTKSAGDDEALAAAIEEAIDENPKALADYRNGESKAVNFLVGQVMKKTRGKADPATLNRMMAEALKKRGQ
ncbi:MAG: Asp-tRNA(Asn)/Glu-tRNA(Gln) amidotransferase GatCAB subunit B, partial [Methanoregula sp.]|nr:Asp-tRNA(Asn)/Glu-tRNA(Gln) amidotransferase GatCAB subunit B [Methanoregula sp.]